MNFYDDWRQWAIDNAKNQLEIYTNYKLSRLYPPETLTAPSYYFSNAPVPEVITYLQLDSRACLDLALNTLLPIDSDIKQKSVDIIKHILYSWAGDNKEVKGWQAKFYLTYMGAGLIDAYRMIFPYLNNLPYYNYTINEWIKNVYLPAVKSIKDPWYEYIWPWSKNNVNSWGWCGYFLAKTAIGEGISKDDVHKFEKFIRTQIDNDGKMKRDVWRTNSGMWYSYFNLVALTRSALLLTKIHGPYLYYGIMNAYSWFGQYCQNPQSWPYKPWPWIFGKIQRLMFPCADEVELPGFNGGWPSDLLETIHSLGYPQNWIANILSCPIDSGNLFRNSTSLRAFGLTEKVYGG
jgi:hypothetical protein